MPTVSFISFLIVIIMAIGFTARYVWELKTGKDSFIKKTWQWIKDAMDALWGLQ